MNKKFPEPDEIVLGVVTKIVDTSVFVKLKDYDEEGVITLAEVSAGRIRTVRDYAKPGQLVVCKVLRVDKAKGHIDLSLRRVTAREKKEMLSLYEQEKEVAILLKLVLKESEKIEEVKKEFGSLAAVLQQLPREAELKLKLKKAGLSEEEANSFIALAKEKIKEREVVVKQEFQLSSEAEAGINQIKTVLNEVKGKVKYLGAPRYLLEVRSKDYKTANKVMAELLQRIEAKAKQLGCDFKK